MDADISITKLSCHLVSATCVATEYAVIETKVSAIRHCDGVFLVVKRKCDDDNRGTFFGALCGVSLDATTLCTGDDGPHHGVEVYWCADLE